METQEESVEPVETVQVSGESQGLPVGKIIGGIFLAIVIIILIVIGYVIYKVYKAGQTVGKCLSDPLGCVGLGDSAQVFKEVGTVLQCPPAYPLNTGLFCNEKCKDNYKWDKATLCLGTPPSYWKGTAVGKESPTDLFRDYIADPIGPNGISDLTCASDESKLGSLCYKVDKNKNEEATSPGFVGQKCEQGDNAPPASCWYDRGWGKVPSLKTVDNGYYNTSWGSVDCTGGRPFRISGYDDCYKTWIAKLSTSQVCPSGYPDNDAGICYPSCRSGYNGVGRICTKSRNIRSVMGTMPKSCANGKEYIDGLCYPNCSRFDAANKTVYERSRFNMFGCTEKCPNNFKETGLATCMKPSYFLPVAKPLLSVGVCPKDKHKIGELCYNDVKK